MEQASKQQKWHLTDRELQYRHYDTLLNVSFIQDIRSSYNATETFSHAIWRILYYGPYEGVSISFRTGRLERELQMVQPCATRCSCIAILWVSLVSFAAITLCVASQRVMPKVSVYFVIDSVRKLLVTPSYINTHVFLKLILLERKAAVSMKYSALKSRTAKTGKKQLIIHYVPKDSKSVI
jgi:hypothetical protein